MISVAMATYNSIKYITRQLNSIVNQTRKVDEVIIVDDCSTDDTVGVVSDFIEENGLYNWHIYRNSVNKGYIKTFAEAIKRTTGDIIVLCDHDDEWMPEKIKVIYSQFENNPLILSLATSFIEIDENGETKPIKNKKRRANNNLIRRSVSKGSLNKMNFEDIAVYNISPGCTSAFRADLKGLFLENSYDIPHDYNINIMAAIMDGLYYLDEVTTRYRIHSTNTIGLGHQSDFSKRAYLCRLGLKEKREIKRLIKNIGPDNIKYQNYIDDIISVFEKRCEIMNRHNVIRNFLSALKMSFGKTKLYESVIYDLYSLISCNK